MTALMFLTFKAGFGAEPESDCSESEADCLEPEADCSVPSWGVAATSVTSVGVELLDVGVELLDDCSPSTILRLGAGPKVATLSSSSSSSSLKPTGRFLR